MYSVVLLMAMTGTPDSAAFGHRHSCDGGGCYGCTGGCYGSTSCYGCSGGEGCCGCHGGERRHKKARGGCHGCSGGCYGGCYGSCYGGCYGMSMGCCGGCYGMPMGAPVMTAPTAPAPKAGAMLDAPATVVVSLPADATLKVDGVATKASSAVRTFSTPVLPAGQSFHYTLTAEVVRDGRTLTSIQQVTVRSGLTSQVELPAMSFAQAVAMK